MILSRLICANLSKAQKISFSKRCMLWMYTSHSNSRTNVYIQNIYPQRFINSGFQDSQMMIVKERTFRQKDRLSDDYILIYFHQDQKQWFIISYCIYFMKVVLIAAIIFSYFTFTPPLEPIDGPMWKAKNPRVQSQYELVGMGVGCTIMMYIVSRGLACTVTRMYCNYKRQEYTVIFLKFLSERAVTIPYDCFKPKFRTPLLLGRESIYTANKHTMVLFPEYFKNSDIAKKVLTNKMANNK